MTLFFLCGPAWSTTYYVANPGSDGNSGTSAGAAWQTLAKVNASSFAAGDTILFRRGDTWNEQLIPPSSGASGNPITFDAYGTGAAPVFSPVINLAGATWTYNSGNIYPTTLSTTIGSPKISALQLGTVWGRGKAANPGCSSAGVIQGYGDFCVVYPTLYVYSPNGTLPSSYYGSMTAVVGQASGLAVISVVNRSWLVFQHIKLQMFDYMGVSVSGSSSDNLVFANMEADGLVPNGTAPHGFYVNATGAGNVQMVNCDAHMNYDGIRVDAAVAVTVTNCRAYANRDAGLKDNTGNPGHVTYSYSHFYGNNVAQLIPGDVAGNAIAGAGNVSSAIAPTVNNFATYPANLSITIDDVGSAAGTEAYVDTLPAVFSAHGSGTGKFNVAVVPSYPVVWSDVNSWYAAGDEIDSHSWSHQYYTSNTNPQAGTPYPNAPALDIRYAGSGTAATLTISGTTMSTTVTGAAGDGFSVNLANAPYNTMQGLFAYLSGLANYTVAEDASGPLVRPNTHTVNLMHVASQDIKTATYVLAYDQTLLVPDEMASAKAAIQANVPGLAESFYVYPDGIEDATTEADAVAAGYTAARGSLAMKGQDNCTATANSLYGNGVNLENIASLALIAFYNQPQASVDQVMASLIFRQRAWGYPVGLFTHYNSRADGTPDVSNQTMGWVLDSIEAHGGTLMTNTTLAAAASSGTNLAGSTRWIENATGQPVNLGESSAAAATFGTGTVTAYPVDLNGVDRSREGVWDIGASSYVAQRHGLGAGAGQRFSISGISPAAQLPLNWVNTQEFVPAGGTYDVMRTATTFAQLQQAICDWVAAPDQWWLVTVPHGTVIQTTATGYTCTQTGSAKVSALTLMAKVVGGAQPTKFIVFDSDTPLPAGQTVCSHGITDATGTRQPPSGDISTWWQGSNWGCADDIGAMWTLEGNWQSGNHGIAIDAGAWDAATGMGASHYAFKNVELRPAVNGVNTSGIFIVQMDSTASGGTFTQASQVASHIHFQNIYMHGDAADWTTGATRIDGSNAISAGFNLSMCTYCSVEYSYFDYLIRQGAEGHDILIARSPGPEKIAHNWMSSSAHAMHGGGVAQTDPWYYINDLEMRANRLTLPPSWIGHVSTWASGHGPAMKNRQEWKTCNRCLLDGNIGEYSDESGAQSAQIYTLTPRACSNSLQCDNYQVALQDITITNNIGRHALVPIQIAGRSYYPANGGGAAGPLRNFNFSNNLFYDMGNGATLDPNTVIANPYFIQPAAGGENFICSGTNSGGTITLNCQAGPTGLQQIQLRPGDLGLVTNCSDATWNVPGGNFTTQKGAIALPGTTVNGLTFVYAAAGAVSATATGCVLNNGQGFPSNFRAVHNTHVVSTTAGNKNNERIFAGLTAYVWTDSGCNGAGPVNATSITSLMRDATGTIVTAAVGAMTGWPALLTSGSNQVLVEVANSGDFSGLFYYLGQSGGSLQWMQPGTPNETGATLGTVQQMGTCPSNNFAQGAVWKNNLMAVDLTSTPSCPGTGAMGQQGWIAQGDGNAEGCAGGPSVTGCSENQVDTTNSVVAFNDFPGRCATKYMEVGGAHAGASPPVTLTFPAGTVCGGATGDATCVGMAGMMNGGAFDGNDSNYHNYGLVASSVYKGAADDGTDLGVNLGALDAALNSNVYVCASYCGVSGPFADH